MGWDIKASYTRVDDFPAASSCNGDHSGSWGCGSKDLRISLMNPEIAGNVEDYFDNFDC
jgi:hypothetical protein